MGTSNNELDSYMGTTAMSGVKSSLEVIAAGVDTSMIGQFDVGI